MGLAGFEPAILGVHVFSRASPTPKAGTLSMLDYRPKKQ